MHIGAARIEALFESEFAANREFGAELGFDDNLCYATGE
jgi:hypothetical protein